MSANRPQIKVLKLSEATGANTLTKILDSRELKDGEVIFPIKLLNLEDGETFDLMLATEPAGVKVGEIVEVENVSISNFPQIQKFGKKDSAVSNWIYKGEKITKADATVPVRNQHQNVK